MASVATILFASAGVQAQITAGERAMAESLFQEGRRLVEDGQITEACKKFEESYRLESVPGTLLNLADCHQRQGRVASAWAEFLQLQAEAIRAGHGEREVIATDRAKQLEPRLPKIVVKVAKENRVPGLVVYHNGEPVRAGAWNTEVAIDPGERLVEAKAPGYKTWSKTFTFVEKGVVHVTVPKLVALPKPPPKPEAQGKTVFVRVPQADTSWSAQETVGAIIGGVGIAAIGVGTYFGLRALDKNSEVDCPVIDGQENCRREDVDASDVAYRSANVANLTVGLGAFALATGIVLYATGSNEPAAPTEPGVDVALSLQPGFAGGIVQGAF